MLYARDTTESSIIKGKELFNRLMEAIKKQGLLA
jgi:hypothetical protein